MTTMTTSRYYNTYSGVKMPFNLVGELHEHELRNRNTYFRGFYDAQDRFLGFEKIAHGEVELKHHYEYDEKGRLSSAEITDIDGDVRLIVVGAQNP